MSTAAIKDKKFIVQQLVSEYTRVSEGFHKAVDNYYKILPLIFSLLAFLTGVIAQSGIKILYSLVPFFLMIFLHFENQIRNTIVCSSKYLAHLERRINENFVEPIYLYESELTIGKVYYYSLNKISITKYLTFIPFFIVGIALYIITLDRFFYYLSLKKEILLLGITINDTMVFFWAYAILLCLVTISTFYSVIKLTLYSINHYESVLEQNYKSIVSRATASNNIKESV